MCCSPLQIPTIKIEMRPSSRYFLRQGEVVSISLMKNETRGGVSGQREVETKLCRFFIGNV